MSRSVVLVCLLLAGCVGTESVRVEPPPAAPPAAPRGPEIEGSRAKNAQVRTAAVRYLDQCRSQDCGVSVRAGIEVEGVSVERNVVVVQFSRDLGDAPLRPDGVAAFERGLADATSGIYPGSPVRAETRGDALAALVPQSALPTAWQDPARRFGPPVTGAPLVQPADPDRQPTAGLAGRHVALWPSHGWLYANGGWGWQRPRLFTSVEDLLTVGFVTRELAPMLERAGAVTLLARERDTQSVEVIVDDTQAVPRDPRRWSPGPAGFGVRASYGDGQNPFELGGTHELAGGTRDLLYATWTPDLPKAGAYAVHVSYAQGYSGGARYTVAHAGGSTDVLVNQEIGGGTWVYLGTFEFEAGKSGSVSLSGDRGVVSADAVRFGGGQGVIARDGDASGRPRWTEASRYYQQFAGAPDVVYNVSDEPNSDYVDDYRSRGEWVNWLRGGAYAPTGHREMPGLGIPVDLALAWHTDAGIDRTGTIGTLAIYNVPGMDSTRVFPNGTSRLANRDLADNVQTQIVDDLRRLYEPDWRRRPLWDRAYSEATRPQVPSLLLELLSHQNFRDMRHALDPRFQFDAARAVYKGIGGFLARQRGDTFVPQPLRPTHLVAVFDRDGVRLAWRGQPDPLEPRADATHYLVQMRDGEIGWDHGVRVEQTSIRLPVPPVGVVRSYRVVAANTGGTSRPSAALAVGVGERGRATVLVVDGFDRVAAPDAVDRSSRAGFVDPVGVPEGIGVVTTGPQRVFNPSREYVDDARPGWGASGSSLEGTPIMGNTRDHAAAHGRALLALGHSFVSASDEAVEAGVVDLGDYDAVDLVLGLERRTAWPDPDDTRAPAFEALPAALRARLGDFLDGGGALVVSGAHWASDATRDPASAAWVRARLGTEADGVVTPGTPETRALSVSGTLAPFSTEFGPERVAVRSPDALVPLAGAVTARYYGDMERSAAVTFGRTVSFGIPLESILDPDAMAEVLGVAFRALGAR